MRWGGLVVLVGLLVATAAAPVFAVRTLERVHDQVGAAEAARTSAQHVSLHASAGRAGAIPSVLGGQPEQSAASWSEVELTRVARDRQSAERRSEVGAFLFLGLGALAAVALVAGAVWQLAHVRRARRAAQESEALARTAYRLAEERRELLGAATNELRGPLTALVLAADMLSDEVSERGDQALAPLAREVASSVRRLTILIEDLLDYIALESRTMTLVRERVDLRAVVEEAVSEVRLSWSDATPVIESRADDAEVWADAPRLRRALSAVLGRMSRRGQRPARIVVADEGGSLTCTVEAREAAENPVDVPSVTFEVARRVVALHGGELLDDGRGGFLLRLPKLGSDTSLEERA